MKRCNENPSIPFDPYIIPDDIYGAIYHHLTTKSKNAFSAVDKQRLKLCSQMAKSICFLPPKNFSNVDQDIYIALIKRYPNIRKITFQSLGPKVNVVATHPKTVALIEFLTENKDCHPFSHVMEMDIEELECPIISEKFNENNSPLDSLKKQNHHFLNAVTHSKLEALTLRLHFNAVSNHTIQSILDKTQLKHFHIKGSSFDLDEISLSFIKQSKLTSLSIDNFIYSSTIKSLVNCSNNLEELGIDVEDDQDEIAIHNYENLKRLKFRSLYSSNDLSFIKKMPNLESLIIGEIYTRSEEQLEPWIDCPQLRELRIEKFHIEEEEHIYSVLSGLSNLELIDLGGTYHPEIEKFMEPIKSMCPKINDFILMHSPHELEDDTPYQRGMFFSNLNPAPKFLPTYDLS